MSSRSRIILIVDDEEFVRCSLGEVCLDEGFETRLAAGPEEALEILRSERIDVVLTDLKMPAGGGQAVLESAEASDVPVVVFSGAGSIGDAVEAMKAGAVDFLQKPVDTELLVRVLKRAIEHAALRSEVRHLRGRVEDLQSSTRIVGNSEALREVRDLISQVGPTQATVLVTGESGTGKELVAHELHRLSPRAQGPLVFVNCAAIPESLFESELFGHRKGAFSGAFADRAGRFQEAEGGTLVLDEIGTLGLEAQAKLLRAIEGREFQVVGESRTRQADVRLVAMTNEDLEQRVEQGEFREDLFYRLNVFPIRMPALRTHLEDLPEIAEALLAMLGARSDLHLEERALAELRGYDWPGNVRELRNVLERASILCGRDPLGPELFRRILAGGRGSAPSLLGGGLHLRRSLEERERELVAAALQRAGGRKKEAAQLLGIDPKNLGYYLRKHGLAGLADGAAA